MVLLFIVCRTILLVSSGGDIVAVYICITLYTVHTDTEAESSTLQTTTTTTVTAASKRKKSKRKQHNTQPRHRRRGSCPEACLCSNTAIQHQILPERNAFMLSLFFFFYFVFAFFSLVFSYLFLLFLSCPLSRFCFCTIVPLCR